MSESTLPVATPPYGNSSSSGLPGGPTGWPNPSWSTLSSRVPAGTASSSILSKTSTQSIPIPTMWHGSGRSLAPPRLFFLLAKVFSLAVPVRGQIVNMMNNLPYPQQSDGSFTFGDVNIISTDISPLPNVTLSSSAVDASASTITNTQATVSFPPEASSSFWSTSSSSEADVTMTVTVTLANCTSTMATPPTPSNATNVSTSVIYVNSTMTHFTTTTPVASDSNITTRTMTTTPPGTHSLTTPAPSSSTISIHYGGDAASLQVLPGWLVVLGMLIMF